MPNGCWAGCWSACESRGCWSEVAGSVPMPPEWLIAMVPEDWYQRYGQRASDYRLPQEEAARAGLAVTVGADGFALLEAVHAADAPGWLRQVPAVQTLRVVWIQQYYRDRKGLRWR